jgi:hypothetical protein
MYGSWQNLYEQMNNFQPNLIPGPGPENSAIGMYMHSSGKVIDRVSSSMGTVSDAQVMTDLTTGMSSFKGFQQNTQQSLLNPVLSALGTMGTTGSALNFAQDLHHGTAFDWPFGGAQHYDQWLEVYNFFVRVRDRPQDHDYPALVALINAFFSLPDPFG